MERKIGEIFELGGEWYQCISDTTDDNCNNCFFQKSCSDITGDCSSIARSDGKSVCFKKLEKVEEPYEYYVSKKGIINVQDYLLADPNHTIYNKIEGVYDYLDDKVVIEIKQTKEDMEEKKLNLKPFSLEAAKSGKSVCTRDGRKAMIICFDRVGDFPIVALTDDRDYKEEGVNLYDINGKGSNECFDLMMLPEKKEGWINIIKTEDGGYCCKGEVHSDYNDAINENINALDNRGITVKIEWEG